MFFLYDTDMSVDQNANSTACIPAGALILPYGVRIAITVYLYIHSVDRRDEVTDTWTDLHEVQKGPTRDERANHAQITLDVDGIVFLEGDKEDDHTEQSVGTLVQ